MIYSVDNSVIAGASAASIMIIWVLSWMYHKLNEKNKNAFRFPSTNDVPIGKGGFGEVWKSTYMGKNIAVKVFSHYARKYWWHEKKIFLELQDFEHRNLLQFVGFMEADYGLLLLTEFHERGSLYEYLKMSVFDEAALVKICFSIFCGIECLHSEIYNFKGKSAIAHRDIKSQNILVKRNGECAIADFGAAVVLRSGHENMISCSSGHGTRRYTAPELLDRTRMIPETDLLMADIYSVGLVLWETCRRCTTGNEKSVEPARVPYYDIFPRQPSWDDMHEALYIKKLRPTIQTRWMTNDVLFALSKLIVLCWKENPAFRPNATQAKTIILSVITEFLA